MKITCPTKQKQIQRHWHLIDLQGKVLGRVATQIAQILMGKAKPYFVKYLDCGDYVVAVNAKKVVVTGRKLSQKIYTSYSGYPGGLKKQTLAQLLTSQPKEVIRRAVYGMLPKNKLRDSMIRRLYVFPDTEHPYKDKIKN